MDLVVADHEGRRWLALPFVSLDSYLALPRWWRWTICLGAAVGANVGWIGVDQDA